MSLFRPEVMENKRPKLYGEVLIPTNIKYASLVSLIFIFILGLIILGLLGNYAKSEQVVGHIVPTKGLIKVLTVRPGTMSEIYVVQGTSVKQGDMLASVNTSTFANSGQSIQEKGIESVDKQIALLKKRQILEANKFKTDMEALDVEKKILERNLKTLSERFRLQDQITKSTQESYEASGNLVEKGHISRVEYEDLKQQYLSSLQQAGSFKHEITVAQNEIDTLPHRQVQRRIDYNQQTGQTESELIALEQRRAEINGDGKFIIQAPISGTVTSILPTVGRSVRSQEQIMTILPEGGGLQAELFVPSRAIGFVAPEQEVKLAYDAFPYQQYGTYKAKIISITRTMLLPEEVDSGHQLQEPVYRVMAAIERSDIPVGLETISLQPGMRLDATIILERFSVLGWFLQSIKGLGGNV